MNLTTIDKSQTFKLTRVRILGFRIGKRVNVNVSHKDTPRFLEYIRSGNPLLFRLTGMGRRYIGYRTVEEEKDEFIQVIGAVDLETTEYKLSHVRLRCVCLDNLEFIQVMNNNSTVKYSRMHGDRRYERTLEKISRGSKQLNQK